MAKPKAPAWLTTAFAEGVLELAPPRPAPAYKGALGRCWLAQHDERRRPCEGPLERAHLIPRQRIRNSPEEIGNWKTVGEGEGEFCWRWDPMILWLAEWDPRNGVVACEHHHRRFDSHLTPSLRLYAAVLPDRALDFIFDWGLESEAERRFDNFIRY